MARELQHNEIGMPRFANILRLTCLLGSAALAFGQEPAKRLETVTWNPRDHKLTWTVSDGTMDGEGGFKSNNTTTYEIKMDAATMWLKDEGRKFSKEEALRVHALMNLISKYAAESTVWWEAGKGDPIGAGEDPKVKTPETDKPRPRRPPKAPSGDVIRIKHVAADDASVLK